MSSHVHVKSPLIAGSAGKSPRFDQRLPIGMRREARALSILLFTLMTTLSSLRLVETFMVMLPVSIFKYTKFLLRNDVGLHDRDAGRTILAGALKGIVSGRDCGHESCVFG